jgi:hypothetical protein
MTSRARCAALALLLALAACGTPEAAYRHSRSDYLAFRARVGSLPEPNYLPFIAHDEELPDGTRALVVCRWPAEAFPLRYYVAPISIPEELQDEFNPRAPDEYVEAIHRAFRAWQKEIGRPVAFEPVADPAAARIVVRVEATVHPEEDVLVLGMVRGQQQRCRVTAARGADQVEIEFSVPEILLFLSDSVGLLSPSQIENIALHEIGHVLGAAAHSPLQADVMYKVATDRRGDVLSEHDGNTFRALYLTPPGMIYARFDGPHERPMVEARRGPPRLGEELRDERHDFRIRFPRGWQVIRTARGAIAVDGLSWDYDASVQVIATRGSLAGFLARQAPAIAGRGEVLANDLLELDGQKIAKLVVRTPVMTEMNSVLEWRPGWVLVVIADCESENYTLYEPWFQQVLLSLAHLAEPPADAPATPGGGAADPVD